jgi:D-tagatose-1,6-bisphosphate aldolase subunit GatZ/KbaZ
MSRALELLSALPRPAPGQPRGMYSVCSAHPLVIEAALRQALADGSDLLLEATCNQVNQLGGYTGMTPENFVRYAQGLCQAVGFPSERLILGGDHLGPNPWRRQPAAQAMAQAREMVAAYARAGFRKLHLDASMACADDPERLSDEVVAQRAAELCRAAEDAGAWDACYVIGTEVPVPGGASEALGALEVTSVAAAQQTLAVHRAAFEAQGLASAWQRVVGMVVQPGVEFDHTHVIDYRPEAAQALSAFQKSQSQFVFEAHSTDYQTPESLAALVRDGFAILKVGPGLSFALREALFALELIEQELVVDAESRSRLRAVVEAVMCREPAHWQAYYHGDPATLAQMRVYSYSDRIRYYWGQADIAQACDRLFRNLSGVTIPENLISQHFPAQYAQVRAQAVPPEAKPLVLDRVQAALRPYAGACWLDRG